MMATTYHHPSGTGPTRNPPPFGPSTTTTATTTTTPPLLAPTVPTQAQATFIPAVTAGRHFRRTTDCPTPRLLMQHGIRLPTHTSSNSLSAQLSFLGLSNSATQSFTRLQRESGREGQMDEHAFELTWRAFVALRSGMVGERTRGLGVGEREFWAIGMEGYGLNQRTIQRVLTPFEPEILGLTTPLGLAHGILALRLREFWWSLTGAPIPNSSVWLGVGVEQAYTDRLYALPERDEHGPLPALERTKLQNKHFVERMKVRDRVINKNGGEDMVLYAPTTLADLHTYFTASPPRGGVGSVGACGGDLTSRMGMVTYPDLEFARQEQMRLGRVTNTRVYLFAVVVGKDKWEGWCRDGYVKDTATQGMEWKTRVGKARSGGRMGSECVDEKILVGPVARARIPSAAKEASDDEGYGASTSLSRASPENAQALGLDLTAVSALLGRSGGSEGGQGVTAPVPKRQNSMDSGLGTGECTPMVRSRAASLFGVVPTLSTIASSALVDITEGKKDEQKGDGEEGVEYHPLVSVEEDGGERVVEQVVFVGGRGGGLEGVWREGGGVVIE
ncbi:hypothetical protein G7K_2083-t1 [Saitoella complicata NRRL Y-17804]|uniref:Uncharacterized protein n=1 Tax=Saitoella complicata (strain BCRC 22490 / CBS 7301 / JCM 7358 / NBRC 10748 / NRRL Y-17804) TaxID=698492 RepID=A0A0E9NDH1_SAICN|nr:hypothetical protein G7K_2083-t1 [Saitoella complicata NRRL Y-17804]